MSVKRHVARHVIDAVRRPVAPADRLVLADGVQLLDPVAAHHEVLAREGAGADSAGEWVWAAVRGRGRVDCRWAERVGGLT